MDKKSNVNFLAKKSLKASKFGENLHYLTDENIQRLWDVIDNYEHKLMLRLVYELGCRVGEFVQIRLSHINFRENSIFFPAENTKTLEELISNGESPNVEFKQSASSAKDLAKEFAAYAILAVGYSSSVLMTKA